MKAFLATLLLCLVSLSATASSHREAPGISKYPLWDNTDVYAFRDPIVTDQLTIISNWIPLEDPSGFPNFFHFDENAWYQIHIDNDGDGVEDITYRFIFTENVRNPNSYLQFLGPVTALNDTNINVYYTYTVDKIIGPAGNGVPASAITRIGSGLLEIPNNAGPFTFPNGYSQGSGLIAGVYSMDGLTKVFAGPRSDQFFVDLGWLGDILNFRPTQFPGNKGGGVNGVAGFNTHSIGLQIPLAQVTKNGLFPSSASDPNSIIGVWADTWVPMNRAYQTSGAKPVLSGPFVQVSRLGFPLINEVIIPYGMKDHWNATLPKDDAQFKPFYQVPELANLINARFGVSIPPTPRADMLVLGQGVPGLTSRPGEVFSDELRLNLAVLPTQIAPVYKANRMGVLGGDLGGFPNGRRPWDDIVDIDIQVVVGVLIPAFNIAPNNQLGDGVDGPDKPFLAAFPYLRSPSSSYTHSHDNPPQILTPSSLAPATQEK
ncbi:MAG TPA: DUF4331 domain-containing protein [Thermoanaerobaculia bacterium]|nr:DUF4331 domain-containing protein [Thermoanaerobaculia bacterium]